MATTSIQWTDRVWNPVRGCALVSPGCERCYAMKQAHRFSGKGAPYEGLTVLGKHGPRWTGRAREVPEMLSAPLRWRKPCRVFVNSMSDLFHEDVSDEFIAAVFGVMGACSHHTFQILTKRPERMAAWMNSEEMPGLCESACNYLDSIGFERGCGSAFDPSDWPLKNVWLGVSVEDQQRADERIPHLLRTPAAVRFLSCEPLLSPLRNLLSPRQVPGSVSWLDSRRGADSELRSEIDWVIVGGESGPGARRFSAGWARSIVKQCRAAAVPVFVKQMGANVIDRNDRFNTCRDTGDEEGWPLGDPDCVEENIDGFRTEYQGAPVRIHLRDKKGGDQSEWPPELRVREYPAVRP